MTDLLSIVERAVAALEKGASARPAVGIILGSGLGHLAEAVTDPVTLRASDIEGYPPSTVEGHDGVFVRGLLGNVPVVFLKGRIHVYEGHPLPTVGLPARILCALGIKVLVITNAAGGIRPDLRPGDLMLLRDHLNLLAGSPLDGPNHEAFGPRFPDMTHVYPFALRERTLRVAKSLGIPLKEGVYAAVRGPQYETPAEIHMLRTLGADAVGMSTVPEAIVASHMRVPALGFSLICNAAAGMTGEALSHAEVLAAANASGKELGRLLLSLLEDLTGDTP